jgi:hypothetical protein
MSRKTPEYKVREGSLAHKVIEHLTAQGAGANMSSAEIKQLFSTNTVAGNLANAITHGMLAADGKGRATRYRLAQEPEPAADPATEPLTYAIHSDGDVQVYGGSQCEDGSVMYTRAHIAQLFEAITRPHTPLPAIAVSTSNL